MNYNDLVRAYAERADYAAFRDQRTVYMTMPMADLGAAFEAHPDAAEAFAEIDSSEIVRAVAAVMKANAVGTPEALRELFALFARPAMGFITDKLANDIEDDGDRIRESDDMWAVS